MPKPQYPMGPKSGLSPTIRSQSGATADSSLVSSHAARQYGTIIVVLVLVIIVLVILLVWVFMVRKKGTSRVLVNNNMNARVSPAAASTLQQNGGAGLSGVSTLALAPPTSSPTRAVAALEVARAKEAAQNATVSTLATIGAVAGPKAQYAAAQAGNANQAKTAEMILTGKVPRTSQQISAVQQTAVENPLYNNNTGKAAMSSATGDFVAKTVATSCETAGALLNRIPESAAGLSVLQVPPSKVSDLVASAQAGSQTISVPSGYCGAQGSGVMNKQNDLTNEDDDTFDENSAGTMGGAVLGDYVDDMAHIDEPGPRSDVEAWVTEGAKPIAALLKNAVTSQIFIKSNPKRPDQLPPFFERPPIPIEGDAQPGAFQTFGSYSMTKNDIASYNATATRTRV